MIHDEVSIVAKGDKLITKFDYLLYLKKRHAKHARHYISFRMRELSCVLIEARKLSHDVTTFEEAYKPIKV